MSIVPEFAATIRAQIDEFAGSPPFGRLESGAATRDEFDRFLLAVARVHLPSPRYLAFLYALSPPASEAPLERNLLEELGRERAGEPSHPALLRALLRAAGLGDRIARVESEAAEEFRRTVTRPLPFATLRDFAFGALCEVVAVETLLATTSAAIARALARHRGIAEAGLAWFLHHSEVDVAHAEQGLAAVDAYAAHYGIDDEAARAVVRAVFRENVFLRRYFAP
jgi:pyrroloquinoline quinone (PQQ) biosynthesis protein C